MRSGKEDAGRLGERLGYPGRPRPAGPLVWVHGASVGESLAVLLFVERLTARGLHVLVTTGTVASSKVLAPLLPAGAFHQFVPLDLPKAATRFFDHWRPDLVAFAESDLWPNLLDEASRRAVPAVLVNARMSRTSFARWRRLPVAIHPLLQGFALIMAQTEDDAARFEALGAMRVIRTGNVKFDGPALPADPPALAALRAAVGDRPVWVAASIHAGEDGLGPRVHLGLAARFPGLLTIVVPRHVTRGDAIAAAARQQGLTTRQRSRGELPDASTAVFIGDTMGEMGLFYRLAPVVFVGKSLLGEGGGQNPIEAIKLGATVLHGPAVANFAEIYGLLDAAGGSTLVGDAEALEHAIGDLLADPGQVRDRIAKAAAVVAAQAGATDRTLAALEPLLAPLSPMPPR